jgi:D-glycero-alpha-D-manno-heptose-7-phosphate kinase
MRVDNKVSILKEMVALVPELRDSLYNGQLSEFGKILHKNWLLKVKLASRISNASIEEVYTKALRAGAIGGKLLGAGGGGFFLFYCEKPYQQRVREKLCGLRELSFCFDAEGSKVIYCGNE